MFTQRISMDCTNEQYEKYLKEELLKMGYKVSFDNDKQVDTIVNNWGGILGAFTNTYASNRLDFNRTYLGSFNAPLFLALAAMTDNPFGGYGEYYTDGKNWLKVPIRATNTGFLSKATKEEIMARFGGEIWNQNKSTDAVDAISYSVGRMPKDNRIYKLNEKGQIEINVLFGATETTEIDAINLLKSKGYKILKPKTWEEV